MISRLLETMVWAAATLEAEPLRVEDVIRVLFTDVDDARRELGDVAVDDGHHGAFPELGDVREGRAGV